MYVATTSEKKRKHLILSQRKLSLAKEILGARTETETIERALDAVISEAEKDEITHAATERFIKSGISIDDVFGALQ